MHRPLVPVLSLALIGCVTTNWARVLNVYYLLTYPIAFLLNMADVRMDHRTGTGLVVKAWR